MTTLRSAMALAVLLGACERRRPETPAIRPVARPAPVAQDRPAPPVDADRPHPDALLLRGLADGSVDLGAHVDPARGVVLVTYRGAGPDGRTPERRSIRHLCGAAAGRDPTLRASLREAVARGAEGGHGLVCAGDECAAPGMEYQPTYRLRLGRATDGTRVLLAAIEASEAALGEERVARVRAFADRGLAAASARPCPP